MTDDAVARLTEALAGQYRIERKLGEGGMATGYLAEDLRHATGDFRVNSERPLFSVKTYVGDSRNHAYSVSPDGRSFYFIDALPGTPSQLIVVTNWWEKLKQKVGSKRN